MGAQKKTIDSDKDDAAVCVCFFFIFYQDSMDHDPFCFVTVNIIYNVGIIIIIIAFAISFLDWPIERKRQTCKSHPLNGPFLVFFFSLNSFSIKNLFFNNLANQNIG